MVYNGKVIKGKYKHTGGVTNVERILSDEGHLQFLGAPLTGGATITGPEDIAFLFKNLESAATENAFAVLIKPDNTYEVLYLSTGGTSATIIDRKLVMTAAIKTGADRVVLVHNHPSGMLTPSPGDKALQNKAELAAKSVGITMLPGVIINLDSGKFLQYDTYNGHDELSTNNTKVRKDQRKVSVLKFDRLKLYQPTIDMPHIVSSRDVAIVLSSFKRGTTEKTHVLISNNAGTITRYFLTGDEVGSPKFMKWLVAEAGTHGNNVFLASNNAINAKVVRDIKSVLDNMDIHLFDVLTIKQDEDIIHNYNSMADDGLLEPASTYGPSEVNDPGVIEVNGVQRPTTDNDGSFDPDKGDIRFRVAENAKVDINRINKSIKEAKIIEAVQDRMISVKRLIQDIEKNGEKVESWENPYLYENTISSVSTYEMEVYKNEYLKPLTKAFADLAERIGGVIDARVYMFARHALERNEKMRADKAVEDPEADVDNMDFAGVGPLGQHILGDVAEGLSIPEIEEELRTFIQETEDANIGYTDRLWEAVNRATKKTLSKWFESGLMGAEQYASVRDMYDYYVPLRGFNEPVAGDVYEYMTSGESGSFQSVVKSAKGRKSMADDPLANISSMAASGIIAGNKNMMKQRMLWMARNHKSPFYNVDKVWFVNDGTEERPSWREVAPEYQPGDTEEQRLHIAQDFYERLTELESRGEAKRERKRLKTGYRMSPYQAKEHQIEVYEMGKKYIININGDPSVAQAINGTNRGDMNDNELLKAMGWLNRQMAANFTVRNPTFVVRNLVRDILYSSSMHTVREGRAYAKAFRGNIPVAMGAAWRYLNGKTTSASVDNHFVSFLMNGGETGYVNLSDFKQHKKDIESMIREANSSTDYKKAFTAVIAAVRMVNRWAELVGRFATYLTSIQSGRDVITSIANSKDATVNFNRKGTGKALSKDLGKKAYISTLFLPYFRNSQLFFNASIQGVANFVNAAGKNPGRFTATLGKYVAIGAITPMLSAILAAILSGDDEEDGNLYWDIPSYVRRNNFVMCFVHKYLAIPLPIELRLSMVWAKL
jgi:hypothetical protein